MKLNLLNILKNVITEQGPIGLYEPYDADDPEYFDYSTIDSESGEIKKLEKPIDPVLDPNIESSTNSIDVDGLDRSNIIKASSVRGETYGWRQPIPRLCAQGRPRYCKWHWHAGRDYSGGGVGFGTPTATLKSGTMGQIGNLCFEINHDDGSKTKHCHYSNLYFKTGDKIPAGAIFQNVGNTQPSTGPHEHFEYYPPGATDRVEKKNGEQKTVRDVDPETIDDKYIVFIKNKDKYLEDVKKFQFPGFDTKPKETTKKESSTNLPSDVKAAIDLLRTKWGVNITKEQIDKELEQEGSTRPDNGVVNKEAEQKILELIAKCNSKFGYLGGISSGYRSYTHQVDNFGGKVKNDGRSIDNVQASNSLPGFSQHHTGKAFDIFSTDTSWWDARPKVKNWVADNAKNYGFDVTYKTKGTLRVAEPWHLYYVGGGDSSNKKEDKKTTDNSSKKTITESTYIIQLGDPSSKKFNIIWGGTSSKVYGANFMKTQGDQYLSDKNIIYSDWENSVSTLKTKLKDELGDGYSIRSVSGFSKGGEKTWNEINSGYDFVGLIDPSTSFARTSLPSNVKMMSNHSNWGGYPKMKEAIKKMEENGLSERIGDSKTYNHDSIPKKFFERYSGNY